MIKHLSLSFALVVVSLLVLFNVGQTQNRGTEVMPPAPVLVQAASGAEIPVEKVEKLAKPVVASEWAASIAKNVKLSEELNWAFGGKQQTGWRLYAPLIAQTVGAGVEEEIEGSEFAEAVARWQRTHGLTANHGVIDGVTWPQMVQFFQARRVKDRREPTADQIVTIPTAECYDESRPAELRQVERETYAAYKRMVAAALADPSLKLTPGDKYLKVISAYRSPAYQAELRRRNPNSTRAGLAVNSPHRTGRALDLYVGGEPVSTADKNRAIQVNTPVYRWLVKNAHRFGFQPYFYEPWHWEYNPQTAKQ